MSKHSFDKIVESRTNERVQSKIRTFRNDVSDALNRLGIQSGLGIYGTWAFSPEARKVLEILTTIDTTKNWPKVLWEKERGLVANALLDTMDEMQKALIAADKKPREDNCTPVEE